MNSWRAYVGNYPDLRSSGIDTEEKALEHWESFGAREGRSPNNDEFIFDWMTYVNNYDDLRAAGITTEKAARAHWVTFGLPEGRSFTTPCKMLCVIAAHADSSLKMEALLKTVGEFKKFCDVVIVSSTELPAITDVVIHMVPNDRINLCYAKYQYYLNTCDYSAYDRVILTNDSYYLIRGLARFKRICEVNAELVAFMASNEGGYHYMDFLRCYNKVGIAKIRDHYNSTKATCVLNAIYKNEVGSSKLFLNSIVLHHAYPSFAGNVFYDDAMLRQTLFNDKLELIKLKTITRIRYDGFPADFDPSIYRALNADVAHMSDEVATNHFRTHGMIEGRRASPARDQINPGVQQVLEMLQVPCPQSLKY